MSFRRWRLQTRYLWHLSTLTVKPSRFSELDNDLLRWEVFSPGGKNFRVNAEWNNTKEGEMSPGGKSASISRYLAI